jgi:hypothetical protein
MKAPRGLSHTTMMDKWRKAVYAVHGRTCCLCGKREAQEVHHYVHRRAMLLRYDWRNGIPLCLECHAVADTIYNRNLLGDQLDLVYLGAMQQQTLKGFLAAHSMTRAEFLADTRAELEAVAQNPEMHRKWLEYDS